jgi:hypothetical protein
VSPVKYELGFYIPEYILHESFICSQQLDACGHLGPREHVLQSLLWFLFFFQLLHCERFLVFNLKLNVIPV